MEELDHDTLSGRALELYKQRGAPLFFEQFEALNRDWLTRFVSRQKMAYAWSFDHQGMAADIFHDIYRSTANFTFRGGPPFRAWIRRLARNKMLKEMHRYRSRPAPLAQGHAMLTDRGSSDPLQQILSREEGAALFASWWILVSLCREALRRLPRLERTLLELHDVEDLSYAEVADRVDLSVKEVGNALKRSRRKAARFLKICFINFQRRAGSPR